LNTNVVRGEQGFLLAGVYSEAIKSLLNHILYPASKESKELEKHRLPGINVVMKALSLSLSLSLSCFFTPQLQFLVFSSPASHIIINGVHHKSSTGCFPGFSVEQRGSRSRGIILQRTTPRQGELLPVRAARLLLTLKALLPTCVLTTLSFLGFP
jgi:hypothetical protein